MYNITFGRVAAYLYLSLCFAFLVFYLAVGLWWIVYGFDIVIIYVMTFVFYLVFVAINRVFIRKFVPSQVLALLHRILFVTLTVICITALMNF